jgi:putative sterol carrier protein
VPRAALAHNRNRRVTRTANKEQIMGVQEIADTMKARVEASGFDRSVKFDTGSDGVIVIDGATISTTDAPTDCTIKLALEDLESLVSGDLNPTSAFMTSCSDRLADVYGPRPRAASDRL